MPPSTAVSLTPLPLSAIHPFPPLPGPDRPLGSDRCMQISAAALSPVGWELMRREVPAAERLKKRGPSGERPQPAAHFGPHKGRLNVAWHTNLVLLLGCSILLWRVCNPVDLLEQLITGSVRRVISEEAFSEYVAAATTLATSSYVKSRISGWKSQVKKLRIKLVWALETLEIDIIWSFQKIIVNNPWPCLVSVFQSGRCMLCNWFFYFSLIHVIRMPLSFASFCTLIQISQTFDYHCTYN